MCNQVNNFRFQQEQIKKLTLLAAKKEGMTNNTELIAISDGAANCWNVIDHLKGHCKSITCIIDWFHIAMRFQNIGGLKSDQSDKLLESAKWSLWHGNTKLFYERINELIEQVSNAVPLKKLNALKQYITNNESKIIDYGARKNQNLIFTSYFKICLVNAVCWS